MVLDYWAKPPMRREQIVLFAPTLDETIAQDDPVRLFDEVLAGLDWSDWEAAYDLTQGQPPIHPRFLAGAWLYGLCRGIRSSRKLEEACCYRLDFMWLVEGRTIDHSTLAKFRTRFKQPLQDLFAQIGRVAMTLGWVRLGEVAFDATRTRANNSRYETRTAETLDQKLAQLDRQFQELMQQAEASDAAEAARLGDESPTQLPPELADIKQRRQRVAEALQKARAADEARRKDGIDPAKNPAQVPTTDPESRVMPNKEGGYAPNYTPMATTDGAKGFIVDADVTSDVNEHGHALAAVERIEETFGQKPQKFLADAGNVAGTVLAGMEQRGVEFYGPVESQQPQPDDAAWRADPTQPVPQSAWEKLPRNSQGQLDKSCFLYDEAEDKYYCPQGRALEFDKTKTDRRQGQVVTLRVYRCADCTGCPLASACLGRTSQGTRTITRDGFEGARQRTAERMATEAGRALYNQRPRIAETTFGLLKRVMGLRQFLLRGLEKVKTEWLWACTAFNLIKLIRELGRLRAQFAQMLSEQGIS